MYFSVLCVIQFELSYQFDACFGSCHLLQVSWCNMEVNVEDPKDLMVAASGKGPSGIPPLTVASLSLNTVIDRKHNVNEIASVSVVYCKRVKVCTLMQFRVRGLLRMKLLAIVYHFRGWNSTT
jgi:hypothetical protein